MRVFWNLKLILQLAEYLVVLPHSSILCLFSLLLPLRNILHVIGPERGFAYHDIVFGGVQIFGAEQRTSGARGGAGGNT